MGVACGVAMCGMDGSFLWMCLEIREGVSSVSVFVCLCVNCFGFSHISSIKF